jgi:hypothetical protein
VQGGAGLVPGRGGARVHECSDAGAAADLRCEMLAQLGERARDGPHATAGLLLPHKGVCEEGGACCGGGALGVRGRGVAHDRLQAWYHKVGRQIGASMAMGGWVGGWMGEWVGGWMDRGTEGVGC